MLYIVSEDIIRIRSQPVGPNKPILFIFVKSNSNTVLVHTALC